MDLKAEFLFSFFSAVGLMKKVFHYTQIYKLTLETASPHCLIGPSVW